MTKIAWDMPDPPWQIAADEHRKIMQSLQSEFGYTPDEKNGENWTVCQGYHGHLNLVVVHPERRPRIYKHGCAGIFYEIELDGP